MAVKLETVIRRYIGSSADTKPTDGVPAGSSFMESDTVACTGVGSLVVGALPEEYFDK